MPEYKLRYWWRGWTLWEAHIALADEKWVAVKPIEGTSKTESVASSSEACLRLLIGEHDA